MSMKKVAILLPWLKMGGTNKVALRFAKELSKYCDVTLILSSGTGELLSEVPEEVHIYIDEFTDFKTLFKRDLKHFRFGYLVRDVRYYLKVKIGLDDIDNYRYFANRQRPISGVFDCAVSYHGQSPERLVNLTDRICAEKKVAWIHGEMGFSKRHLSKMQKYYDKLDHFFFVSNATRESFEAVISFDRDRSTVYYNPIDRSEVIERSKDPVREMADHDKVHLLTVGRISSEKGQDMIPKIARSLIDRGYDIEWYLIGDGSMENAVLDLIEKYGVEKEVIMLGVKNNPYCYMRACDIYVQPSYTEGYSTTVCEAAILGKAIIGTEPSGGIKDQITDGVDGIVTDASPEALEAAIVKLIEDTSLRRRFEREIVKKDFEGKGEIGKFLSVFSY